MHFYNQINKSKQLVTEASLHIYFMLRTAEGVWQSTICSSPNYAVRIWKSRKDIAKNIGILHIGFDRPLAQDFVDLVDKYLGRVLITTAAKHVLPASFLVSAKPIAHTGNFAIYLGLRGWGYSLKDPTIETDNVPKEPQDWILSYIKENRLVADTLSVHKIHDDTSYLEHEHNLDSLTRQQLGIYRTHYLVGASCKDPCELARAAPPWLAQRKLKSLNITTKAYNIFDRNNLRTVADLASWTSERLLKEPLLGYKTFYNILTRLDTALNSTPMLHTQWFLNSYTDHEKASNIKTCLNTDFGLITDMKNFLLTLYERECYILTRRLGFQTSPQSIRQIADSYGIESESLHYIEIQSIEKMRQNLFWHTLIRKIIQLLQERDTPLSITSVETIDLWFKGISDHQIFLKNLVRLIDKDDIHILKIDSVYYFSVINQTVWDDIVKRAKTLLYTGATQGWRETEACLNVQKLLPDSAKEFSHILWEKVAKLCCFDINANGTRTLRSYGKRIGYIVKEILNESDCPLHYKKITELASLRREREPHPKTVRIAANHVGLLFEQGTYGLSKHIPFTAEQMNCIRSAAEHIVCAKQTKKQWHAFEILSALPIQIKDRYKALDNYLLNIILSESRVLKHIGKMDWIATQQYDSSEAHISNARAIINILEEAGRPLSFDEIRKRMVMVKGVSSSFCIPPCAKLVRMQHGLWGINDRDVPISRAKQRTLIEELIGKLNDRQIGIHLNEVADILPLESCAPYMFFSIAARDKRLRVSTEKYIYLNEWGAARRE